MKETIRIGNRVFAVTASQIRDMVAKAAGKRKPKLKRAADRAWKKMADSTDKQTGGKR